MAILVSTAGGPTKRALVEMAYEECAIAGFSFELTADELAIGARRLDAMMAEWPFDQIGYVQGGVPDDLTGVSAKDITAIVGELAKRVATSMGKTLPPEQIKVASRTLSLLTQRVAVAGAVEAIPPVSLNTGAGNGRYRIGL